MHMDHFYLSTVTILLLQLKSKCQGTTCVKLDSNSEYRVKREATLWTSAGLMLRLTPHFTSSTNVIVDSGSPSFFLVNYVNSSLDEHQLIRLVASAITLKQNSPSPK
ncbi:hypothetical protein Zmor_005443 [Zophobas morio]|uniref:Uncharacterized protein n=1 Tax=Zophobas morio TaxID=2755281 RepID=A0AA38ISX6_9CUCU|nr:hypothetical protein Zmor_005443 [Zophobas morio]